ncbi:MAG: ABC transporter ATP-binding protein [Fuerstiella sp.]|jgi:putative ABC transport system ATP-binding protein|nr:ABC transporter ATP-binding protein [Fuerstiella sp.]MCP4506777.1 ABC transporter ATP-binding protein [Fuerstiella sp.]MDG2128999.1 ABC transporter ATP-binding protein [Fuerstiella sp.]
MIEIQQLKFCYPRSSFHLHISELEIETASVSAVVGPSGSGKTTLLHLVAGILPIVSGKVLVDGTDLAALSDAERRKFRLQQVGLVFQDFELIDYLSVSDNVLLPCRIGDAVTLDSATRKRAEHLLEQSGLADHLRKPVTNLSQGEKQRVAICRALLTRPAILLADEPTGNLDPATSDQILELMLSSARENDTTVMMVTHDHSLLNRFDRVIDFEQFLTTSEPASCAEEVWE